MTTRSWRYRILPTLPLALLASLCGSPATASTWNTTQLDNAADVGKFASIAAEGNKNLHLSYYDTAGKLRYISNKSGSWPAGSTVVAASGVVGAGTSITVDAATGNPEILYYYNVDTSTRGARSVAFNGTGWNTPVSINGIFLPATEQSISVYNRDGISHALYLKNNSGNTMLYYVRNAGAGSYGTWNSPQLVDSSNLAGFNNAIVADSNGKVFAVGYDSSSADLRYYTNESGSWATTTLASSGTVGKWCSLAIDPGNNLHLSYLEYLSGTGSYHVRYRYKPAGGAWGSVVDVADAGAYGGFSSIKADSIGKAHISYYYATGSGTGKLRYATNLGGSWAGEDVDTSSANVGQYSSLAIDADQNVSIAYYDASNSALKLATRSALLYSAAPLQFGTVDRGFQSGTGSVTVTNNLPLALSLGSTALAGADLADFAVDSDSCANTLLQPQGSCSVQIHFAPAASAPRAAARSAAWTVQENAPYQGSASLILSGTTSPNYLVTATMNYGGSISPAKSAVAPGGSISFNVTPASGFTIGSVIADGSTPLSAPYALGNVNADHSVAASAVSPIRMLESSIYYGSLQSALSAANSGWTIETQSAIPSGDLLVDRDISVNLSGGYDGSFSSQTGTTALPGSITVSNGTLAVENVVIQ